MTTVLRCICCDLPAESCGKQVEERLRRQAAEEHAWLLSQPGWISSEYPGRCSHCGEFFLAGTPIIRYANGWACCA